MAPGSDEPLALREKDQPLIEMPGRAAGHFFLVTGAPFRQAGLANRIMAGWVSRRLLSGGQPQPPGGEGQDECGGCVDELLAPLHAQGRAWGPGQPVQHKGQGQIEQK